MPRLPVPGSDDGTWGGILNDYLLQAHNSSGALRTDSVGSTQLASGTVTDAHVAGSAAIAQSKIANLTSDLASKAADSSVVHLTGSQTITGAKTFSVSPTVPAPSLGTDAATKLYVDTVAGSGAPDADATTKGILQLTGDLSGTAASPTVPGLAGKEATITAGTTSQYYRGDKSWQSLDKTAVGLANVDNTSDASKPVSSATQTALNAKADTTITISSGTGLSGGGDLSANRTLSVTDDTTTQKVRVSKAGLLTGTRQEVNLVEGSNVTITTADDVANNRVNVTIASTGGSSPTTTKGDIIARDVSADVRVPVGTDGQVLTADSAQAAGVKWSTPVAAAADAVFTVAASDTPASLKANADYTCDGTADDVQIQAAIDAAAQNASGGGEVVLLQGTYNLAATVSVSHPTDSAGTYRIHLRFERGAKVRWTTVTGVTPLIKVESSDCLVTNPWLQGSGTKGNGYGLVFGGNTADFGGRYTKTVYRSSAQNVYCTSLTAGVVFGVDRTGSSSSGDNTVFGGYISSCQDGILSAGFTNRVYGITIATCDNCIHGTPDRNSHMIEVFGSTLNQWANAAVYLEKDKGSTFVNLWAEHTSVQSAVPTQAILLGGTTNSSYTANNTRFLGTTSLTLLDETYAVRHVRSQGVTFENLSMSTNGNTPTTAIIRFDSNQIGTARYKRITWQTGNIPATWSYAMLASKDVAATGTLICEAIPGAAGATNNTTVGDLTPVPSNATYYVDKTGSPNAATYWAKDATGHIAMMSADTASTSGLDAVLTAILVDDTHIHFGKGRYHFLDAPLGTEAWANDTGFNVNRVRRVSFSGEGFDTILSTRSNSITASPDLGVLLFTNCEGVTIRDMTVEFCGAYMSTMEAVNCNQGTDFLVERVRFNRSKSTALTMDGGDIGKSSSRDVIRDCIFEGRPGPVQVDLVTSGGTLTNGLTYNYLVSFRDADLLYATGVTATTAGTIATFATSAAHGLQTGDQITVQSMDVAGYNGRWTITSVPDTTHVSADVGASLGAGTGGVLVGPGLTKPSDPSKSITPSNGTSSAKVYLPLGPYSTQARYVYRYDGTSWKQVATINDNTTITWTDTGVAGTAVTMPVSNKSLIPHSGVQLLATSGVKVVNNFVDGVGDAEISGASDQGIRIAQKQSKAPYNNLISGNSVRQSGGYGIHCVGATDNIIVDNHVTNAGTVATKAQAIRLETSSGLNSDRNTVRTNRCYDDQTAASWSGGQSMNNIITIAAGGNDNLIEGNYLTQGASATVISDSGTNTIVRANKGHNPQGVTTITVGASPYAYTAGATPEAVYISGGTVSDVAKNASTIFAGSPATVYLEPHESVTVTYTVAPTMMADRK